MPENKTYHFRVRVTFQAIPDFVEGTVVSRLGRMLKGALRAYGFKAIEIEELNEGSDADSKEQED